MDSMNKKMMSLGSLSPARQDKKGTRDIQNVILKGIKNTKWSGIELHRRTGISLAMCRRLVRGDRTDMKVSTLIRLIQCKEVGLNLVRA